jgi:hypothetical protein
MKRKQRTITYTLLLALLLPGILGNVQVHACLLQPAESCCNTVQDPCCPDEEQTDCGPPACTDCEFAETASENDDCACMSCTVTLPETSLTGVAPKVRLTESGFDAVPLADTSINCTAPESAAVLQNPISIPTVFPGIPTTVLLI